MVDAACLQAVQGLLGLLPISIAGLGVREALFAGLFPKLGAASAGFSEASGTSYGLMLFVAMYIVQVLIGAIAWQIRPPPSAAASPPPSP